MQHGLLDVDFIPTMKCDIVANATSIMSDMVNCWGI